MDMIEDGGPFLIVALVVIIAICFYFAYRQSKDLNEMEAGHLYMLYFFGVQTPVSIMNEIGNYSATQVFWDLTKLEKMGLVERSRDDDEFDLGRIGRAFKMTDAGEIEYRRLSELYDLPRAIAVADTFEPDPREAYRCERDC
jgi:DNA-binding MarR family transcriptional regulator